MRVLAIGCHPDDLEINCFGTLAIHAKRGDEVYICNIANGCMGDMLNPPEVTAAIRLKEAKAAAEKIGAKEYICLGVDDLSVNSYDEEQLKKVVDVIRKVRPDYILSHGIDGYMDYQRDHNEAASLVFNASFVATIPNYKSKYPVYENITPIYFFEPSASNAFRPTDYVDISDVIDLKLEALRCHESQVKWLMEHVSKDVVETTKATAMFRGRLCKTKYAEAFKRCDQVLRMTPKRMLP